MLRSLHAIASVRTSCWKADVTDVISAYAYSIELEPSTVEQVPFTSEYVEKMPKDYYLYCVIDLGLPELGEIVIEIDLAFVIYIHECWLDGDSKRNFTMRRPLTAFEF